MTRADRASPLTKLIHLAWVQSTIAADTLITLDKQSLTPANTQVEPIPFADGEAAISATVNETNNSISTLVSEGQ